MTHFRTFLWLHALRRLGGAVPYLATKQNCVR